MLTFQKFKARLSIEFPNINNHAPNLDGLYHKTYKALINATKKSIKECVVEDFAVRFNTLVDEQRFQALLNETALDLTLAKYRSFIQDPASFNHNAVLSQNLTRMIEAFEKSFPQAYKKDGMLDKTQATLRRQTQYYAQQSKDYPFSYN